MSVSDGTVVSKQRRALGRVMLFGIAGVVVALVLAFGGRLREPTFEGRRLSDWIVEFRGPPGWASSVPDARIVEAFRAMGPVAQRRLLQSVRRSNDPWRERWNRLRDQLGPVGDKLPRAMTWDFLFWLQYRTRLSNTLGKLLPESLPTVLQGASSPRADVREAAMRTLGAVEDPDAQVRSVLLRGIGDSDDGVQLAAISAIKRIKSAGSFAVPSLIAALQRTDPQSFREKGAVVFVRAHALLALGDLGPDAREALPVIKEFGPKCPDAFGRVAAARALWKIERNLADSFPVLKAEFDAYDHHMKWMILECFKEMGTNAVAAMAQVKAFADAAATEDYFRSKALEALRAMEGDAPAL